MVPESNVAQTSLGDTTFRPRKSNMKATMIGISNLCTTAIFGKSNGIEILDAQTFAPLSSFGLAIGETHSEERRYSQDMVWNSARKELNWSIPHLEEKMKDWMEQFMSLQPGQPYFLRALNQLSDGEYLQVLISHCLEKRWFPTVFIEK